jgi:hypothetical protein
MRVLKNIEDLSNRMKSSFLLQTPQKTTFNAVFSIFCPP